VLRQNLREHRLYAIASTGIAVGAEERPEKLPRAADMAMHQAKGTGKGRHPLFDPSARG
jgi:PleD family two-component response regulator